MGWMTEDFLLQSSAAQRLYHEYAAAEPIFDYHCHLPPEQVAKDYAFQDLAEIWLGGDHYKWRAMRANGVDEHFCTGDAPPFEKFRAYCETVPHALRNPLYHWSHLELKRYFEIELPINGDNAQAIWEEANRQLQSPDFRAQAILRRFKVKLIGTTDDPTDSLEHHHTLQDKDGLGFRMIPTFRPDKGTRVDQPEAFNAWVGRLENLAGRSLPAFADFLEALRGRHDLFHDMGGRASDHGLDFCPSAMADEPTVDRIYREARKGRPASALEREQFGARVLLEVGRWNHERGWVMQFHLGALRNASSRMFKKLGPDTGYDSIGDWRQGEKLARFLDLLDAEEAVPKMIFYNLNPADNYVISTLAGDFQDGKTPGKIQFGSGWWFLDQKEAMEWQMNALSNNGLLSRFVGMLTDSRSFMSYCRHEYFRRVLCNLVGQDMEDGLLPTDFDLCGSMVKNICYRNAERFFFGDRQDSKPDVS